MHRKLVFGILVSILLISILACKPGMGGKFIKPRVRIIDFYAPDKVNTGETFFINVTIRNNRLLPVRENKIFSILQGKVTVQVNLLSEIPLSKIKVIGENTTCICRGGTSKTIPIKCVILESDITWPLPKYNVQALLYKDFPLLGWSRLLDRSNVQGIYINSTYELIKRLIEKDKVRIDNVIVPQTLKENEDSFITTVEVVNEGAFDVSARVRVDMIERPSVIPELEEYIPIKGLASLRKELGRSKFADIEANGGKETFEIKCYLRDIESKKKRFIIEAVLFVNISGKHYKTDSSTLYEIYHNQPFCFEQDWPLVIGAVFGGLIAIGIIAVVIRILYPLYRIKKTMLKEEKERIDKRKH